MDNWRHFFYFIVASIFFNATMTSCDKNEVAQNVFTVYFNSNGGSEISPQMVKEGRKVIKPDAPSNYGYMLSGWYKQPRFSNEWMFDVDVITSDTTLYAKWEKSHHFVFFYSMGGSEVAQQAIKIGEFITEPSPAPTREGHRFDGWYNLWSFEKWNFSDQCPNSDIFLYAKWVNNEEPAGIEGISFDNYPKVDGSTSSTPLNKMIACKLLGVNYRWDWDYLSALTGLEYTVVPYREEIPEQYEDFFWKHIICSQTHGAIINLIDGVVDIILSPRTLSPDEKAYMDAVGVTLIETPIALDAFVFIVNKSNTVKSLSVEQIQKIYTGEITNWSQVGGNNAKIDVFTRPRNSGSEEIFRTLVMKGLHPLDFPESEIFSMSGVFPEINNNVNGICYTFNTYKEMQVRIPDSYVPKIAINNIFPDKNTVKSITYPFTSEVYVVIRSNLDRNSMAYKLYEWIQSAEAKYSISECGFVPK